MGYFCLIVNTRFKVNRAKQSRRRQRQIWFEDVFHQVGRRELLPGRGSLALPISRFRPRLTIAFNGTVHYLFDQS